MRTICTKDSYYYILEGMLISLRLFLIWNYTIGTRAWVIAPAVLKCRSPTSRSIGVEH